jgi:hypothetical protein
MTLAWRHKDSVGFRQCKEVQVAALQAAAARITQQLKMILVRTQCVCLDGFQLFNLLGWWHVTLRHSSRRHLSSRELGT